MPANVSAEFELPHTIQINGMVRARQAGNIPAVFWPDGRWCLGINIFLLDLVLKDRSTLGRGGTITVYASQLSHLVRFCFENDLEFLELTDNDFSSFVYSLTGNCDPDPGRKRSRKTARQIALLSLTFLDFLAKKFGEKNFVGRRGCIQAERILKFDRWRNAKRWVWFHKSLPVPSQDQDRMPVSDDTIDCSSSKHLRQV